MTLIEIKEILEATGYPVAYSHFTATENEPIPEPPYLVYLSSFSSNLMADNKVHYGIGNVQIELYTKKKDLFAEAKVETILTENEVPFETTESFIESEELYQKIYEVRLL